MYDRTWPEDCDRRQTSPASLSGALRRGYAARRTARRYAVAAGRGQLGHDWSGTTLSPGEATIALSPGCNTTGTQVCARAAPSPPARRSRPTTPRCSCPTQRAGRPQMKGITRGKFNTLISLQPEFRRVAGLKPTRTIHPPTASGRKSIPCAAAPGGWCARGVAVRLDAAGDPAAAGRRSPRPGRLRDLTH